MFLALAASAAPQGKKKVANPDLVQGNHFTAAAAAVIPPDVDSSVPPVLPDTPCALPPVIAGASKQIEALVNNLQQFSATERVDHQEPAADGSWGKAKSVEFAYVVEFQKIRNRYLVMNETRDGGTALAKFPAHVATLGLPALALVFHPMFVGDFDLRCEGKTEWEGQPAWQVHFQQRADKVPRLRSYRIKDTIYLLKLKGRAWISADTYQVLHIDSDLLEPVPQVNLLREHLSVEYKPVHFKKQNADLWLPDSAELFMDFRGRRFLRRHSFSNFLLFSVDLEQRDKAPKDDDGNK